MRKFISLSAAPFLVLAAFLFTATGAVADKPGHKPKLVVQITVDMLRGDMPWRYYDRFGKGGFRYLMDKGTVFSNAYYQHSTTFTAVGHAALFTGGNAAQHGMAGNDWYDQETGQRVYCIEDPDNPIIGKKPSEKNKHKGTSPRNLTSSTTGDELVFASGGQSRVFSVSIKDRGAIIPGGQLGKAFWYSSSSGKFVTSTYYYDKYPAWVEAWNKADIAGKYQDVTWVLKRPKSEYVFRDSDDRPSERGYKHLKRTFPHKLGSPKKKNFYKALRFTPMGDVVTLNFVKELMKQERVGQGDATDMLAVSFSATDYLGHAYGPDSLEYEDNMLRLDANLADFFGYIDKTVGLDNTLIVLSADHGVDSIPESLTKGFYMTRSGEGAGRHDPSRFLLRVNAGLQKRYNSKDNFVAAFWNPSLYLDLETVKKLNLDIEEVESALRDEILKVPGMALAVTRTELLRGEVSDNDIMKSLQLAFHPTRSGNVLVIQKPGWYLYPQATLFSAMHGSPYSYDTFVPIMFAGPNIKAQVVSRRVAPTDIAATIANYLGIKPPSASIGLVLPEVVDGTESMAKKTI